MLNVSTFPCPNCHEFISTSMTTCKYCSVPIDPQAASTAVELQDKVNRACNDASLVRNLAGAMWVFFFVRLIPIIGYVASSAEMLIMAVRTSRLESERALNFSTEGGGAIDSPFRNLRV